VLLQLEMHPKNKCNIWFQPLTNHHHIQWLALECNLFYIKVCGLQYIVFQMNNVVPVVVVVVVFESVEPVVIVVVSVVIVVVSS
jgi:hypothetical protein